MYPLSERCKILRENAIDNKPYDEFISGQREYYFTKGICDVPAKNRSNCALITAGLNSVILNAPPVIQDGELVVGYNYGDGDNEKISTNIATAKTQLKAGGFSEEEISWYLENRNDAKNLFVIKPPESQLSEKEQVLEFELAAMGWCMTDNHSVIGYEQVLHFGFVGLLEKLSDYPESEEFYSSMRSLCLAACALGETYAKKAEQLRDTCSDEKRKNELNEIIEICNRVPKHPARNFKEAVQSLWFAHIINTWEDGINANSLGRLDQILYPYYKNDIDNNVLTKEEAFEIICCLWIKLYRDYDVQQSCVGGCDSNGNNAENEVSYLMLDATEKLGFVRCISVRYSNKTPKKFIQRALEVVGHVKKGVPFFFNDDVLIPALVDQGILEKDARDYSQIGCVETVIPGKSNPHAVTGRCNLLKAIEYTMSNGKSMLNPYHSPGLQTGELDEFTTFEKFKEAVEIQIMHLIDSAAHMVSRLMPNAGFNAPKPYKSLLTENCIESGRDFNDEGALYDFYQIMLLGIPNLADSLMTVKELVYNRKMYTLEELFYHLKNNFPDEAVRLDCVNKSPKYGNDIDEVDFIAADIINYACDCLEAMTKKYGYCFHAQPFTFLWMIEHGHTVAATPDGRRNGDIIAYSASPMQGYDFNGIVALLNSLSKLPTKRTPGTTSAIVEADPLLFTDNNIPYFADTLLSETGSKISNIQFNIVDVQTLVEAQKTPEKYRNLAVRVSGFSQKFHLLDKALQDHIIKRTKHTQI